ncbi:histidine kinase [Almyronema epifaneia]|uniref:Histidine kinase n=1 Tax=Almyronema epifaneia S1 TaxID=2991925 RepID=A0ABW6IDJ7_9CYAN
MTDDIKTRIQADIEQAKTTGKLRGDRLKEIVRSAVAQATAELKEGTQEMRVVFKDAIVAVVEAFRDRGSDLKSDVEASLEGGLEAISQRRRQFIAQTQAEIEQLQTKIANEEKAIEVEAEEILDDVQLTTTQESSSDLKAAIAEAIATVKNSEEANLLQKRYAQLQTQLSILQANLAARYGERYEEIKQHLDKANSWYEGIRPQGEEISSNVQAKHSEFQQKMAEAGKALARKEQDIKRKLQALWQASASVLSDDDASNSSLK